MAKLETFEKLCDWVACFSLRQACDEELHRAWFHLVYNVFAYLMEKWTICPERNISLTVGWGKLLPLLTASAPQHCEQVFLTTIRWSEFYIYSTYCTHISSFQTSFASPKKAKGFLKSVFSLYQIWHDFLSCVVQTVIKTGFGKLKDYSILHLQ